MERLITPGLIYRLIKYSDSSAIAFAFTRDYGKIKLFIPKAYSKKSGIMKIIPGEIDFLKKDTSDLNKFYDFRHNTSFMFFVEDPVVSVRLHLIFDVFDNLFDIEQKEPWLWSMILRFNRENYISAIVYIIYFLLKKAGLMFNCNVCSVCGKEITGNAALSEGIFFCGECAPNNSLTIKNDIALILKYLGNPNLYKNLKVNLNQEKNILDIFIYHLEFALNKKLKSYSAFKSIIGEINF